MSAALATVADAVEVAQSIRIGNAALCPWEWLGVDAVPADWAAMMMNFARLLDFPIGIKHVQRFRVTVAIHPLHVPPEDDIGQAIARLENYRDHGDIPPTRQAMLLATQRLLR